MKKLFSLLLVTLMLLSPFAMCVNAESVTEQAVQVKDTNKSKITSDLQAHLDTVDDDEYVPVYVWLNDYGEDMLYEVLSQRLGKTVTSDTEEAYIQDKIEVKEKLLSKGLENLAKTNEYKLQSMSQGKIDIRNLTGDTFKAQANLSGIMTDEEIDTCIESNMTSSEIIELSERNQFLSDYRQSRKAVNTAVNTTFYNSLDLDKCRNVYLDPLLCRVTMECKKSYVDDIERFPVVFTIEYRNPNIIRETVSFSTHDDYNVDNQGYYMTPHDTLGYNGAGIRIGVLESRYALKENDSNEESLFDGYYIDLSNPHLANRGIITNIPVGDVCKHASSVLSVLAGSPVTVNGVTYQGVATGAAVYYTNDYGDQTHLAYENAFEWFIDNNVSVVNISWGVFYVIKDQNTGATNYVWGHNYIDKLTDMYIAQYRISVVVAAGNEYSDENISTSDRLNISNPASAYNAITVGNISNMAYSDKYNLAYDSCYAEADYATNKPDISMFGSNFHMYTTQNAQHIDTNIGSGTSYSAPIVTATVALMMQANPKLLFNPDTVKAVLLNSADETAIRAGSSGTSNLTYEILDSNKISGVSAVPKEKSGAGLLSIKAAIRMAQGGVYYPLVFSYSHYFTTEEYIFNPGTTLEITLVYENNTNNILRTRAYLNNLDIQIIDSNDNVIMQSTDEINNVEAFKVTIATGGWYRFKIVADMNDQNVIIDDDEVGSEIENNNEYLPIDLYATFTFSCACKEKVIIQTDCQQEFAHRMICDACGPFAIEPLDTTSRDITLSNGIQVYFGMLYLFERGNRDARDLMCEIVVSAFSDPSSGSIIVQNLQLINMITTPNVTGETREYYYSITFVQNGNTQTIYMNKITVVLDYFAKTVTILY